MKIPDWQPSTQFEGVWNCWACGSLCSRKEDIPSIEHDCLQCWSLRAAQKEDDTESSVMPPSGSKTLMDIATEVREGLAIGKTRAKSRATFGPLCLEIAEAHLYGNGIEEEATEQDCHDLAQVIQDAIDSWFTGR